MDKFEKALSWFVCTILVLALVVLGVAIWAVVEIVQWLTTK